jgi:BTB/POZ domain
LLLNRDHHYFDASSIGKFTIFPPLYQNIWPILQSDYSTDLGKEWVLFIYFTKSLHIEIYIQLDSEEDHDIFSSPCVHTELSLIVNGQKHETQQKAIEEMHLQVSHCIWKMKIDDFKKFMERNCKDDSDFIRFEIKVWNKETITVTKSHSNDIVKCLPISNTMINFLTNQTLADVTLQCQEKNFKAHKVILAAASPVFGAMFKEGTKEHEENNVIIEDIESDVFELFLRYLYSGEVGQLKEMHLDLFAAADKYDVQPLREICIRHMSTNISHRNAGDVLALAELHCIEPLKSLALEFIERYSFY